MTIDRRGFLVGGALAASAIGLAGASARAQTPATDSLDAIAQSRGLRFGSTVAWSEPGADKGSFANPAYARLVTRDCGLIVPENEMKWQSIRPSPTTFDFARFDAMVAWAEQNRLVVRGHNLLWHQSRWLPDWLNACDFGPTCDFGSTRASAAESILSTHIRTVIGRYGDRILDYDVVNETVDPKDGSLYETALSKAFGGSEAMLDSAFRTARQASPRARLVYNDFMNWDSDHDRHRSGVLKLLEGFRRRGTPVDALGLQAHLVTSENDGAAAMDQRSAVWRRFLDAVTDMGYDLVITELDLRDNGLPADVAKRDAGAAAYVKAFLDVTLSYRQVKAVLSWGLSDRYSWIEGFDPRKDGARRRPTLYDADFKAKPMRGAVAAALAAAPAR